jgi:hypothetical protein
MRPAGSSAFSPRRVRSATLSPPTRTPTPTRRSSSWAARTEGDFGFAPAGLLHAYRVEQAAQMMGVASGGFERFFQQIGTSADTIDPSSPPFVPDFPRMQAAAQAHRMEFRPDFTWPDA